MSLFDLTHAQHEFQSTPQEIEDMLFAAGLAYSVVRDQLPGRAADKQAIDAWLAS